jgi:hypothetical protein
MKVKGIRKLCRHLPFYSKPESTAGRISLNIFFIQNRVLLSTSYALFLRLLMNVNTVSAGQGKYVFKFCFNEILVQDKAALK